MLSAQSRMDSSGTLPIHILLGRRSPLQLPFRPSRVLPMPLPPEVAKGTTFLPEKSPLSRNVLMMVGATYHQMGKGENAESSG